MAARCGHSDQTGGEGQQQSVTGAVQRQRQELTSLRRVLGTPGDSETQKCEDREAEGKEPAEEGQCTLSGLKLSRGRVKGLIC